MSLTRHPPGSFREMMAISFPLMLSSLSVVLMLFVDRLLLARYSLDALNASVTASTVGWAFISFWLVLGGITEVFVAQYHGAGDKQRLGAPVWQMLYLSLFSFLFFIPLAYWGDCWFFRGSPLEDLENDYFRWMIFFGPAVPMYAALCGFFIGQGKTKLVTILAFWVNVFNAILDVGLIFGVEGWIPEMGVKGAAIATSCSSILQGAVLFCLFINEKNRHACGTGDTRWDATLLARCVKVGLPGALFVFIEMLGWGVFYALMTDMGEVYITIAGVCQNIVILFYFLGEGISKGATAVVGNLIGAKKDDLVTRVFKAGLKMHLFFLILMLIFFPFFYEFAVDLFLVEAQPEFLAEINNALKICLLFIVFLIFFEGVRLLLSGILTAAGDTRFLLIGGSLSVWILMLAPIYYAVNIQGASIVTAEFICVMYSFLASLIYFWRFYEGKWRSLSITA